MAIKKVKEWHSKKKGFEPYPKMYPAQGTLFILATRITA
jgi:hypothetical protein